MATIYAANTDGPVRNYGEATWNAAHDSDGSSGTVAYPNVDVHPYYGATVTADSSGANPDIYRAFFAFDTSGISVTPSSAILYVYTVSGEGDLIAVKATAPDLSTDITAGDFNNLDGGVDSLTAYSAQITTQGANSLWSITLNAAARSDMADGSGVLKICLMNYDHDYLDVAPTTSLGTTGDGQNIGFHWSEYLTVERRPRVTYEVGYGQSVLGVAADSINNVNGVLRANVLGVLGVED